MNPTSHFDLSDEQFAKAFDNCSLDPALFSHEAHLRLAWIHLNKNELEPATQIICDQIINFVSLLGEEAKYHHTLTVAAIKIVHHFIQKSQADNFLDFILAFPTLKTDFKALIQSHYSFDIFKSTKAKETFLEPDLLAFE